MDIKHEDLVEEMQKQGAMNEIEILGTEPFIVYATETIGSKHFIKMAINLNIVKSE